MFNKLIYLAAPYSHPDLGVMQLRRSLIAYIATKLIEQGHHIFSPVTESACYADMSPLLRSDWETWAKHDRLMLTKCDEMWVLMLKGWKKSIGVATEIAICNEPDTGIPITYIDVDEYLEELI